MSVGAVNLAFDAAVLNAVGFAALGRRFVLWRTFPPRKSGGKPVKLPCTATGYPVDGTDERGWLAFDQAVDLASRRKLGLGVALGWGFCGLDLDHCRGQSGELSDRARRIVRHFPTYCEVSPSATGIKAYFLAGASFTTTVKVDSKGIELYAGRRFFALTGKPISIVVPIGDSTAAAVTLARVLRPPRRTTTHADPPVAVSGDVLARIRACEPIRERPSVHGGTVYTLRVCPFTGEAHAGGGSYALTFLDGAAYLRCDRSSHGPRAEIVRRRQADSHRSGAKWHR